LIRFKVENNEKRGGTMTCHIKQLLSISLFALGIFLSNAAFGIFFSNAAQAQCTPTLYLFRHAEDVDNEKPPPNQPAGLTAVGTTHAMLYADMENRPGMISQLQNTLGLCPVQRVFAMWNRPGATGDFTGTTNPYKTALPLAQSLTNHPPPSTLCPFDPAAGPPTTYLPEMCFKFEGSTDTHVYYLCEFKTDDPCTMHTPNFDRNALDDGTPAIPPPPVFSSPLLLYLSNYFQTQTTPASVAIFFTSDGMPGLSTILGFTPVVVECRADTLKCQELNVGRTCPFPVSRTAVDNYCWETNPNKGGKYDPILSWPGVQRSSANVFYYLGNQLVKQYNPIDPALVRDDNIIQKFKFQQCYNLNYASQKISTSGNRYCQFSGNLANNLANSNSVTTTTVGKPPDGSPPVKLTDIEGKICSTITRNFFPDTYGNCNVNSMSPHDLDANMISDIVWRDTSGDIAVWLMSGAGVASSGALGNVPATWSLVGQRDFDGNGTADLLWRDSSGNTSIWFMSGTVVASTAGVGNIPANWTVVATGDFNGDGLGDILWTDGSGNYAVWLMNGSTVSSSAGLGNISTTWSVVGAGDFNGDGNTDILWQDNLGNTSIWFMNGTTIASTGGVGNIPTTWTLVGTGDFNGDGMSDLVWRDGSGNTSIWLMNGAAVSSAGSLGTIPTTSSIAETGDYNGDGMSDLLWRDTSGNTSVWFMNGTAVASTASLGNVPTNWTVQSVNAE
jgi:hypothetical protein